MGKFDKKAYYLINREILKAKYYRKKEDKQ